MKRQSGSVQYELGFHKIGELCEMTFISTDLIIIYRNLGCLSKSNHPDDDKSRRGDVGGCDRVGLHDGRLSKFSPRCPFLDRVKNPLLSMCADMVGSRAHYRQHGLCSFQMFVWSLLGCWVAPKLTLTLREYHPSL